MPRFFDSVGDTTGRGCVQMISTAQRMNALPLLGDKEREERRKRKETI
jgi:hypothetical protein